MSEKRKKVRLRFFNEAVEYIDKFDNQDLVIQDNINSITPLNNNSTFLRDEMLNELNNLREIIRNNPDLKIKALSEKERELFYKFVKFYKDCPICGNQNHFFNLKQLFFDEEKKVVIEKLIRLMTLNSRRLKKINLQFGVPCCNCYKQFLKE
jgi:transcription-repair coupling factor (superfamily II helicase)